MFNVLMIKELLIGSATKETIAVSGTVATIFGGIASMYGGLDKFIQLLAFLVVLDYITGLMVGWATKTLSSQTGFKGICKKIIIFGIVLIATKIDQASGTTFIRNLCIMFYISNEGISLLENAGKLGVKYPRVLKDVLIQLNKYNDKEALDENSN